MESKIYNIEGKEFGSINLPESIFGIPWNSDLVHQVIMSEMSNRRSPIAHTKTRGEVRGGGKKPWKQKGTGRARHGSTRSPIWVGGGVSHGPRNDKNFERKVNKKMRAKALLTALAKKYKDGEIIFIDAINFSEAKTKFAKKFIDSISSVKGFERLGTKKINTAYIAMSAGESDLKRSFVNFGSIQTGDIRNLCAIDIATYKYLIITHPDAAIKAFEAKVMGQEVVSDKKEKQVKIAPEKKTIAKKKVVVA